MARISYRNKLRLKKLLRFCLICLAAVLVLSLVLVIYVEPYVIYDRQGARLELSPEESGPTHSVSAQPRPVISNPNIIYSQEPVAEMTIGQSGGYYITTKMLQDPTAVLEAVKKIQSPCAVFIELKSVFGYFYYSSDIAAAPYADVDIAAVDQLIEYLREHRFYMIGVVSAFSDRVFALANQSCGLPLSGGALWMDSQGCYWLDPADKTVIGYLMEISRELKSLGFSEVAFSQFCFPDTNRIVYSSEQSKDEVLSQTITELTTFLQGSGLTVSFVTEQTNFPTQAVSGRLYFPNVDGSNVERYALAYGTAETVKELVFLANSRDTRFEGHAQLRPLMA